MAVTPHRRHLAGASVDEELADVDRAGGGVEVDPAGGVGGHGGSDVVREYGEDAARQHAGVLAGEERDRPVGDDLTVGVEQRQPGDVVGAIIGLIAGQLDVLEPPEARIVLGAPGRVPAHTGQAVAVPEEEVGLLRRHVRDERVRGLHAEGDGRAQLTVRLLVQHEQAALLVAVEDVDLPVRGVGVDVVGRCCGSHLLRWLDGGEIDLVDACRVRIGDGHEGPRRSVRRAGDGQRGVDRRAVGHAVRELEVSVAERVAVEVEADGRRVGRGGVLPGDEAEERGAVGGLDPRVLGESERQRLPGRTRLLPGDLPQAVVRGPVLVPPGPGQEHGLPVDQCRLQLNLLGVDPPVGLDRAGGPHRRPLFTLRPRGEADLGQTGLREADGEEPGRLRVGDADVGVSLGPYLIARARWGQLEELVGRLEAPARLAFGVGAQDDQGATGTPSHQQVGGPIRTQDRVSTVGEDVGDRRHAVAAADHPGARFDLVNRDLAHGRRPFRHHGAPSPRKSGPTTPSLSLRVGSAAHRTGCGRSRHRRTLSRGRAVLRLPYGNCRESNNRNPE